MSNETDYIEYLNSVSVSFNYYCLWILMPTGIIGNIVSLYIYTRPNLNKKTNTGRLYVLLCALNLITIAYFGFVYQPEYTAFNYSVRLPCGLNTFLRRTLFTWLSWIQVVISFDRYVAVIHPTKVTLMNKKVFS